MAPLLAPRVQADLRVPGPRGAEPAPEPGTIILAQDQSMLAATEQAWRWIDRLGIPGPNPAEPLPPPVYVLAAHVAASPQRRSARVRVRAADGTWMAIRAAALTTGSQAAAGYAITLKVRPADDLAPLLMRAWGLTRRERDVARLVIDGRSTEDIATALFISVHTARPRSGQCSAKSASAAARTWPLPSPEEHPAPLADGFGTSTWDLFQISPAIGPTCLTAGWSMYGVSASDHNNPRPSASSGTRRARHDPLICRSGHIVRDRPSPVVGWADIPELSTCVGRCPVAWQQCWQQVAAERR